MAVQQSYYNDIDYQAGYKYIFEAQYHFSVSPFLDDISIQTLPLIFSDVFYNFSKTWCRLLEK